MKNGNPQGKNEDLTNKVNTYLRSVLSALITLFGLIYLLLVLSGHVDKQSKRFQIPEVIIFTVVLLINSESLQRLSKLQFGKDGVSFELNELKEGQKEIKQNQERIQATQAEQREYIAELRQIFENFLENNQSLVAMLKRASEISISDKFFPVKSSSKLPEDASVTSEDVSEMTEDSSNKASSSLLSSLLKLAVNHPDLLDPLVTGMRKERRFSDDKTQSNHE
jgi:hypothetical protein